MIEEQDYLCKRILSEIKRIPISKLFTDQNAHLIPKQITKPITLDIIEQRLDRHVYANSDEWVSDMRRFFMREYENSPDNSIRKAAAMQLSSEFEKLMVTMHPSLSPHIINVQIAEHEIREIANNLIIANIPAKPTENTPCASIFSQKDEEVSPKTVIHKIRLLKSPELILRVLGFIYKKQPECILFGQSTSIEFCFMKQELLESLDKYLKDLLYDAASGKIDPLRRSGFSEITPVELKVL